MSQYIVQGIFAVAGIISLLAAILGRDWFFTAQNTQFGRTECRPPASTLVLRGIRMILIGTAAFFSEYSAGSINGKTDIQHTGKKERRRFSSRAFPFSL
ncbi:MAG: immunity 17 family protein [Bacteroides stercoris]